MGCSRQKEILQSGTLRNPRVAYQSWITVSTELVCERIVGDSTLFKLCGNMWSVFFFMKDSQRRRHERRNGKKHSDEPCHSPATTNQRNVMCAAGHIHRTNFLKNTAHRIRPKTAVRISTNIEIKLPFHLTGTTSLYSLVSIYLIISSKTQPYPRNARWKTQSRRDTE